MRFSTYLFFFASIVANPTNAATVSGSNDIIYRFATGSNSTVDYQINFSPSVDNTGGGLNVSFGTTRGGSSLGSYTFPSFTFGAISSSIFPNLSTTGYTYLTFGSSGADIELGNVQIGIQTGGYRAVDGIQVSQPTAYVSSPSPSPVPASQGASVITAFRNYVEGAQNTDRTYLERLNDCAAQGADCDFDAVASDQEFQQNLQNAADATYASKDLVTRTSLLPENKLELAADAPTLIDEIRGFFQWLGLLPEDENRDEIINTSVEGESGEFTVNPTFESYALSYIVEFNGDSFFSDLIGKSFLFNKSLSDAKYYAGYGVVESVDILGNGNSRAIFSISQLESNNAIISPDVAAVPLPAGFYLLASGFLGLVALGRRRA